jgi:transcription-repair coupling factor (superfamily II helicase)
MKKTKLPATDHQIFERYHKFSIKMAIRKTKYHFKRTHDTFGWGLCYARSRNWTLWWVAKIQSRRQNTTIKLVYADNIVYVSIHSLHKISKLQQEDGTPQNIQTGFECVENFKQKNQSTCKHIVFNLIQLYTPKKT